MKYKFEINIRPCVNFSTKAAEVYASTEEYDGAGKGLITRQKHISSHNSVEEAEQAAEAFCLQMRQRLELRAKELLDCLTNAKP